MIPADAIGVCDVLFKPVHQTEILQAVEECLDRMPATIHWAAEQAQGTDRTYGTVWDL